MKIAKQTLALAFSIILLSQMALPFAVLDKPSSSQVYAQGQEKCGNVELSVGVGCEECNDNVIFCYLEAIIRFFAAGVGLVVVLMIVVSGIQYITAQGNSQAIESAKNKLTNAVIALLLFIFMSAILNFLIPGGLL